MGESAESNLGKTGVDTVSGFTGTITGVSIYLSGYKSYQISPSVKGENEYQEPRWIDAGQVNVANGGA